MDVESRLRKVVVEHLGVDAKTVTLGASIQDDLGADSLDLVEVVMAVEEEFGVEIQDDSTDTIVTFGDLVRFVDSKVA
jgi:acyl carrier protein